MRAVSGNYATKEHVEERSAATGSLSGSDAVTGRAARSDKPLRLTEQQRHAIAWEFAMKLATAESRLYQARACGETDTVARYEVTIDEASAILDAVISTLPSASREIYLRNARDTARAIKELLSGVVSP
jgi:hypothetical protein